MLGTEFLPISRAEVEARGWDRPDFVYITGDAYVDHPSFGVAIISRVLEAAGYRVAILAQPNWKTLDDVKRFGKPNGKFRLPTRGGSGHGKTANACVLQSSASCFARNSSISSRLLGTEYAAPVRQTVIAPAAQP